MTENLVKIAVCYDFDGTLAPGNMQEYGFMDALQTTPEKFWKKANDFGIEQSADMNLAYMLTMIWEMKKRKIPLTADFLAKCGKNVPLFKGVDGWFQRLNNYAKERGIELQHFLLSSGVKEIVGGMPISKEFTRVYACSFLYDEKGEAMWPAQVVNYTTKTQFLFRISKGCLDEMDGSVNDHSSSRDIPFERMMYIGDGSTDVPCMATLRKFGGSAIAVYPSDVKNAHAEQLLKDGRASNIALTDYSENSKLDILLKAWIDKIRAELILQPDEF